MRWSDKITLFYEDHTPATDEAGFTLPQIGDSVTVFANKKAVGYREFFLAKQAGHTEQMKFDIFAAEYNGQTLAEYEGKRYRVLRTYNDPKKPDEIELTLSDLSERGMQIG